MHEPVLLREVISLLSLKPGDTVLDGTAGSGGHAEAILEAVGPKGRLIGIDQDKEALGRTEERLKKYSKQLILIHSNFSKIDEILANLKVSGVSAVLLDIGVSLEQLSDGKRGFSFRSVGPIDMRMDQSQKRSAFHLIHDLSEEELARIFREYGEERRSLQIARWIVDARERQPLETTKELAELVEKRVPAKERYGRIHPATRIFQALRIAVNDELGVLEEALPKALNALSPNGRLAVITFHSLEDRIVKRQFVRWKEEKIVEILTKKPMMSGDEELTKNPRSRSAKLRAVRKAEHA